MHLYALILKVVKMKMHNYPKPYTTYNNTLTILKVNYLNTLKLQNKCLSFEGLR
jgi:hypothetical protein